MMKFMETKTLKMENSINNVDNYIQTFPKETQQLLTQLRTLIKQTVPLVEESISYAMPVYKLNKKPLVYFAAYKKHIGFYATPTGHKEFANELAQYKQGKGSVQFPIDKALPFDLIKRMLVFKVNENYKKQYK
jgi:uncharacterized protein YdhG (YjbR/CyaY superfamily)